MEVTFEPQNGEPFTMIVDFYDTVEEIKQKIQIIHGIPASDQTLFLDGHKLPNDGDTDTCKIFENSRVALVIAVKNVRFRVKIPTPTPHNLPYEMDENDTVLNLKDSILASEPSLSVVNRSVLVLQFKGQELQDDRPLREYDVASDDTVVEVSFRWTAGNDLKVILRSKCGTRRIPVWVNSSDNVRVLRPLFRRLKQDFGFPLPPEYFFIHKQNVMDDDRSFQFQGVAQGDSIEAFPGSYTYASSSEKVTRIIHQKRQT